MVKLSGICSGKLPVTETSIASASKPGLKRIQRQCARHNSGSCRVDGLPRFTCSHMAQVLHRLQACKAALATVFSRPHPLLQVATVFWQLITTVCICNDLHISSSDIVHFAKCLPPCRSPLPQLPLACQDAWTDALAHLAKSQIDFYMGDLWKGLRDYQPCSLQTAQVGRADNSLHRVLLQVSADFKHLQT